MSVDNNTIFALQGAFPEFLEPTFVKKALSEDEKKALKLFTDTLTACSENAANAPLRKDLRSIQINWLSICHELCLTNEKVSAEFFKNVTDLKRKLNDLGEIDDVNHRSTLLISLLRDSEIAKTIQDTLSEEAKNVRRAAPKAIYQLTVLTERLIQGLYGETLRLQLYDLEECQFLQKDRLICMLYIDMHLRGVDPKLECEWFSECDATAHNAIRQCFRDLKQQIRTSTGLGECQVNAMLIDKATSLPKELQKKFDELLTGAKFVSTTHKYALELIRTPFSPEPEHLHFFACKLIERGEIEKALRLAYSLYDKTMLLQLFDLVADKDLDAAKHFIRCLKLKLPDFTLEKELEEMMKEPQIGFKDRVKWLIRLLPEGPPSITLLQKLVSLLSEKPLTVASKEFFLVLLPRLLRLLPEGPSSILLLQKLVSSLSEKPLNEVSKEFFVELLNFAPSKQDHFDLLESGFAKILATRSLEEALNYCTCLILKLSDDVRDLYRSLLLYQALIHPRAGQFLKLVVNYARERVTDKTLRRHVCNRLVSHYRTKKPNEAVQALKNCEEVFTDQEEKMILFKARIILTASFNKEEALKLAKTAPDEHTQITLQRLCTNPPQTSRFVSNLIGRTMDFVRQFMPQVDEAQIPFAAALSQQRRDSETSWGFRSLWDGWQQSRERDIRHAIRQNDARQGARGEFERLMGLTREELFRSGSDSHQEVEREVERPSQPQAGGASPPRVEDID